MQTLAFRSVPLSESVRGAWRSAGVRFRPRNANATWLDKFNDRYEMVLNLGSLGERWEDVPVPVWNHSDVILQVSHPNKFAELYSRDLAPPATNEGSHWHKGGGFGGANKKYCPETCDLTDPMPQKHIAGSEYRILSVGNKVVQASRKHKTEVPFLFNYEWIGVNAIKSDGFIPLIKNAVERIKGFDRAVIGWDVIHDGSRPFLLEANTSPGVNEATAGRIIAAMKEACL